MKAKYLLVVLLGAVMAVTTGCRTNAVYNVPDQSVLTNKSQLTEEDVKKAIIRAGSTLGWNMFADKPGNVLGTLRLRKHMAQVDIYYDLNKYNITYKDSQNLNYEAAGSEYTDEDGNSHINKNSTIHSNYNGWVQNLDRAIKAQLNTL